ncbi:voltage-gated chloride channel protein, partial [Streptococcus pyogenes]
GSIDFLFGEILLLIGQVRNPNFYKIIPFLAPIGLFIIFLYQKWGKNAHKGLSLIFEVGHGSQEAIPKRLIPLVMVTTWLTHL